MNPEQMEDLFAKYVAGELDPDERQTLTDKLTTSEEVQKAFAEFMQWSSLIAYGVSVPEEESEEAIRYAEMESQRYLRTVPRRRRRGVARIVTITAATLAVAAAIMIAFRTPSVPSTIGPEPTPQLVLTKVLGDVTLGTERSPARAGRSVAVGDTVQAPSDGRAGLIYEDGTTLEMGPGTLLRIDSHEPKTIHLVHGSVEASVKPQPEAAPMSVSTDAARVEVLGTQFTAVASDDGSGVEVTSGAVRYVRVADGASLTVEFGRSCVVADGAEFAPIRLKVRALLAVARASVAQRDAGPNRVTLTPDPGDRQPAKAGGEDEDGAAARPLTDGLIARFAFDEGAGERFVSSVDAGPLRGIAGHLEYEGDGGASRRLWSWVDGRYGKALRFTPEFGATREDDVGAIGVVSVPTEHNVLYQRRDHSISAWVKYSGPQHGDAVTALFIQPGWINGLTRYRDSAVMVVFDAEGELAGAGWDDWLTRGKWHHLVGVFDTGASVLRLYIDGRLAAVKDYAPPAPRQGKSIWLIGGKRGLYTPTECAIDEVRVYDRVLTGDEVKALHRWEP